MTLSIEYQPIPLTITAAGAVHIEGTRVPLETVIRAFHQGATAEEIAQDYPTLTLAQVYACLLYTSSKLITQNSLIGLVLGCDGRVGCNHARAILILCCGLW